MHGMKKSRKYGLIAGGVALGVLAVVAFVFSGYNKERLPTLPTPTGVVVPAGMRYVGGDEFDAPDGSAPDVKRWLFLSSEDALHRAQSAGPAKVDADLNAGLIPTATAAIKQNSLRLDSGKTPKGFIGLGLAPFSPGEAGVVEWRIRVLHPQKLSAPASFGWNTKVNRGFSVFPGREEKHLIGIPDLFPIYCYHPKDDDEVFHTYSVSWHGSRMDFAQDGITYCRINASEATNPLMMKTFSRRDFHYQLPQSLGDFFMRHMSRIPGSTPLHLSLSLPGLETESTAAKVFGIPPLQGEPPIMDIDYVRIFQE